MEYKKALTKAMQICSRKEQCVSDINEKLLKWDVEEADARKIISLLVKDGFINEERYIGYYINDKLFINKWGKRKVLYTLKMKKIPEASIQNMLANVDESKYREMIFKEIRKKKKTIKGGNHFQVKSKLFNFGASRGYEPELTNDVIRNLFTE